MSDQLARRWYSDGRRRGRGLLSGVNRSGAGMTSTGVRGFSAVDRDYEGGSYGYERREEREGDSGESALPICNIVENSPVSSFPLFPLAASLVDFMDLFLEAIDTFD